MGLREEPASGGARFGCMGLLDRGRRLLLTSERAPAGGADRFCRGGGCFWRSSRCMRLREQAASGGASSGCMGLLDLRREEAVSGGAPAARGCSLVQGRSLSLGSPPPHGAACFLTPFLLPVSFRI